MKRIAFATILFAIFLHATQINLHRYDYVVAYEDAKFEGPSLRLFPSGGEGCQRLPDDWVGRISSVDVIGGCVEICHDPNCQAPCKKICSGIRGENNLTLLHFDDLAVSYRRCTCAFARLKSKPLG